MIVYTTKCCSRENWNHFVMSNCTQNSGAPFCLPWHFFFFLFGLFSYSPCELLCSHYGFIGFNGAETNCGTAKLLGILQMNGYLSYGLQILRLRTTSLLSSLCRVNNYYKSICGLQLLNRELSKDKYNDGSENVGKKMNFRFFKLNRIYLDPIWTR